VVSGDSFRKAIAVVAEASLAFFFWFFAFATLFMPIMSLFNPECTLQDGLLAELMSGAFTKHSGGGHRASVLAVSAVGRS